MEISILLAEQIIAMFLTMAVGMSVIFCIITMPLMVLIYEMLIG